MFEIYFDLTFINLLIPTAISGAACGQQMEVWSCATLWPVSLIYCQKSERECQKHLIFSFFCFYLMFCSRRVAQCKVVVFLKSHCKWVFSKAFKWQIQLATCIYEECIQINSPKFFLGRSLSSSAISWSR